MTLTPDTAAKLLKDWERGLNGREPTATQRATMARLRDIAEGFKPYASTDAGDTDEDI